MGILLVFVWLRDRVGVESETGEIDVTNVHLEQLRIAGYWTDLDREGIPVLRFWRERTERQG